jgi:hypothetical protein
MRYKGSTLENQHVVSVWGGCGVYFGWVWCVFWVGVVCILGGCGVLWMCVVNKMDQVTRIVTIPALVVSKDPPLVSSEEPPLDPSPPQDGQVVFLKDVCITNIKKIVSGNILTVVYTVSLKALTTFPPTRSSCNVVVDIKGSAPNRVADCDTVDSEGRPIPLSMFYNGSEIMGSFVLRKKKLCALVLCLVISSPYTQRALMMGAMRALYAKNSESNEP